MSAGTTPASGPDTSRSGGTDEVLALLRSMDARLATLEQQVAELKQRADADIPEDVVLAISAAVSAYLGNRAKVRAVHFRRTGVWAQQGRAAIQGRSVLHVR